MPTGNTTAATLDWRNLQNYVGTTTWATSNTMNAWTPTISINDSIISSLGEPVSTVARVLENCVRRLECNGISVKDALKSFEMFVDSLIDDKSAHSLEDAIFDEDDLYAFLLGCEEDKD